VRWRIVRKDRSVVRVELLSENGKPGCVYTGKHYINIEGSKAKGYRWYSGTEVLGCNGFEGKFKDVSQDAAIETAIKQWNLRLQEIVNSFYAAEVPESAEDKGGAK